MILYSDINSTSSSASTTTAHRGGLVVNHHAGKKKKRNCHSPNADWTLLWVLFCYRNTIKYLLRTQSVSVPCYY